MICFNRSRSLPMMAIAAAVIAWSCSSAIGQNKLPENGDDPDSLSPSWQTSNWEHLRWDEFQIAKLGGADFAKGLNKLGSAGYRLTSVTTKNEKGAAGYFIFKRQPWKLPLARPQHEYLRIDEGEIEKKGEGKFDAGLAKVERDGWELVAFTTTGTGGLGFYFFEKPLPPKK
jgi:hypothetical protein